jgi:hypothetical protein
VREIYRRVRPRYVEHGRTEVGRELGRGRLRLAAVRAGRAGILVQTPSVALPPGRLGAAFRLARPARDAGRAPAEAVARLEAFAGEGRELASRDVLAAEIPADGRLHEVELELVLEATVLAGSARARSLGSAPLVASLRARLHENVR